MSSRMKSKKHGLHMAERIRPSSKFATKIRKAKTRIGQGVRHEAIMSARAEFAAAL